MKIKGKLLVLTIHPSLRKAGCQVQESPTGNREQRQAGGMQGEWEQVVVLGTHVAVWGMSWLSQKKNRRRKKKLLSYVFVSSMIWLGQRHAGGVLRYH